MFGEGESADAIRSSPDNFAYIRWPALQEANRVLQGALPRGSARVVFVAAFYPFDLVGVEQDTVGLLFPLKKLITHIRDHFGAKVLIVTNNDRLVSDLEGIFENAPSRVLRISPAKCFAMFRRHPLITPHHKVFTYYMPCVDGFHALSDSLMALVKELNHIQVFAWSQNLVRRCSFTSKLNSLSHCMVSFLGTAV